MPFRPEAFTEELLRRFAIEIILSVTTIVGVNLLVSLLSASNFIKQQPLIFVLLK